MNVPQGARPFLDFVRLLRRYGFAVAPEQGTAFMAAVALLGPRDMEDIRQAAHATLAPAPDRRGEFETLFRSHFHGDVAAPVAGEDDEETAVKDSGGEREDRVELMRREEGGALSSAREQLSVRRFATAADDLDRFRRGLAAAMPARRSFRSRHARRRGTFDLRRSLRAIVAADGDLPRPLFRRRAVVPRKLLLLVDVSGSMKRHTEDYLAVAHAAVQALDRVEVFTLGTRLTRITPALAVADRGMALDRAAATVEDWDGGTRLGPTLLAFLSVPRFAAFARGAAVVLLSDALERGDPAELALATRRLSARAFRLSLATPLAGDPRYRPQTAALAAILPLLDDLVDGASIAALTRFILALGRTAPSATAVWRRAS
ncbi:VWA domain-containing protein [Prosthecomicrobium pneumaticum]|uniref:VWA containing CoxE family protein n=1 Tax=Prosthecomicrobium pneumaticum TaxID=81895 RepID=A0A7W9CVN6_9HYPH|nr:VWA domain-containing protein [Prosthecomicrobium pneumaticum]MBB5752735.1 hypothetical protein [Prosthecomicrobium pneumaticum]